MERFKGSPKQGLQAATLGFFVGFAAVALFGTTAVRFNESMELNSLEMGILIAMPALTGSLLRIPFSGWVDSRGGRIPLLTLLVLSTIGMLGLTFVTVTLYPDALDRGLYVPILIFGALSGCGIAAFSVGIGQVAYWYPQAEQGRALAIFAGVGNLAPGLFTLVLPIAMVTLGLGGAYIVWTLFLVTGAVLYGWLGRDAWYFQLIAIGTPPDEARNVARENGQELFPGKGLKESLMTSAKLWQTWALVSIYFVTFGGFIALTAWLPTYWVQFHGLGVVTAGLIAGAYSILTSLIRVGGGILSDQLREGGANTGILALIVMLMGAVLLTLSDTYQLAIPAVVLMALGMGVCNAAVFKLVPQLVPNAVGGTAGWVGGLGAFGGFLIPLALGFAVEDLGTDGYSIGMVTFVFLATFALTIMWILKYTMEEPSRTASPNDEGRVKDGTRL